MFSAHRSFGWGGGRVRRSPVVRRAGRSVQGQSFLSARGAFCDGRTSLPRDPPKKLGRDNSRPVSTRALQCSCANSPMRGVLGRRPKLSGRQGSSWPFAGPLWAVACQSLTRFRVPTRERRPVEPPRPGPPREAAAEPPAHPRVALPEAARGPQAVRAAGALGCPWIAARRRSGARHFAA